MDRGDGQFSCFVSDTLNCLGYKPSCIKERRQSWEHFAGGTNTLFYANYCKTIVVGSKGEGTTALFQNDIDTMMLFTNVIAADDTNEYRNAEKTLFKLDMELTPPGYTKLKLVRRGDFVGYLMDIMEVYIETCSGTYASSEACWSYSAECISRQGPACTFKAFDMSFDCVQAIPCQCPTIMSEWLERHRKQDWPSQDTIHKIVSLDAHVVPVGFKQSPDQSMEWRISYTLAELVLVHSFNDGQTKVYILLKLMAKHVMNPVSDAMTSYVVKNVMFWLAEWTPLRSFSQNTLIDRLVQAFEILRKFIKLNFLPNYMIPGRNLLAGKFDAGQRRQLLSFLDELIADGGCMLFRCKRLRLGMLKMYQTPERARTAGERRDAIETAIILGSTTLHNDTMLHRHEVLCKLFLQVSFGVGTMSNLIISDADKEILSEIVHTFTGNLDLDEHILDSDLDVAHWILILIKWVHNMLS